MNFKKWNLQLWLILALSLFGSAAFAQSDNDTTWLGLPGDNLNLYAVLDLFQDSKTIEDFEKALNDEKSEINNLDLDLDSVIDFIKVKTEQEDQDFIFILQVDVNEKETQDVAVILVSKDKKGKVSLQIVGDEELYGKDYVIEPKPAEEKSTPNPAYTGTDPVPDTAEGASTTVESSPVIVYIYSPVYVPYYPPYYYGYYPPYYARRAVVSVHVYHHHYYHYPYHHVYHGGGHNTVIIHNHNTYNHYYSNRRTSTTVVHHNTNGNYNRNNASTRPAQQPQHYVSPSNDRPQTTPTAKPRSTPRPRGGRR
jgi:hypothetical protein